MLALSGKALAAPPNLYFTQNNLMVNGSSLYVQVHANSVSTPVNAVQADFTYPTGLLHLFRSIVRLLLLILQLAKVEVRAR
jgi:hypothetical protein